MDLVCTPLSLLLSLIIRRNIHFNPDVDEELNEEEDGENDEEPPEDVEEEEDDTVAGDDDFTHGDRISVKFQTGWFQGTVQEVTENRVLILYDDPFDRGPHWSDLDGDNAIIWKYVSDPHIGEVWFKKVQPFIEHVRAVSLKMVCTFPIPLHPHM